MENKYNQIRYRINEMTPLDMRCGFGACPAIYSIKEVTPSEMICGIGACPGIYLARNISAELNPASKEMNQDRINATLLDGTHYFIIGEQINPLEVGLEKKVNTNEALIKVPRSLIDRMEK